jgi:ferredoxin
MTPKRHSAEERRWFEAVASLEYCVLCGTYGVQVAHSNRDRGIGLKAPACCTAALCPACHAEIDNGSKLSQAERRALMDYAIVKTHARLIQMCVLRLGS